MKICILTHTMPRFEKDTNSASFISELAESLSSVGNEVTVLAPYDPSIKKFKRSYKVINYKYIWPNSWHTGGYSRVFEKENSMTFKTYILSSLMSISALVHLIKLSNKYHFDVVSAHWVIPNGFIAFLASLMTRVPYTITIPGSDVYLASKKLFFKIPTRLASMNAKAVISDSVHYLSQLNDLGINPRSTHIIRYGVDTDKLKPLKPDSTILKHWGVTKNKKIILCLGRFVEKKGFIYAIEAMPQILKKFPNTQLILIGGGELQESFEKRIKKLNLQSNVIMPGYIPYQERAKYYNLADVFVMPSVRDSKGNIDASPVAMMDAMACGIPVIATKYSGDKNLVKDNQTGFMVKEKSSIEIAKAAIKLFQNSNSRKLSKETRAIAVNNFSLKATAKAYQTIFKSI